MSRKRHPLVTTTQVPGFIRPKDSDGGSVQITVRIPASEKSRLEAAQELLQQQNLEMSITDIVRNALRDACQYVEQTYLTSQNSSIGGNQSQNKGSEESRSGNHSSKPRVEEWGAAAISTDSATRAAAPPLTGSAASSSERPGVGLAGRGGEHGQK